MTTCTRDPIEDIGHGVRIERRYLDGVLDGIAYWHPPDALGQASRPSDCHGYVSVKPTWNDGWDIVSLNPLTLSPSLLCRACGHHGFIREGRWVPA